jgi:hypothetical protein
VSLLLPFGHTTLCLEDTFSISYTVTYPFRPGNKFSVQLSDSNGSFLNNPTIIGSVTATTAGSILCEIPSSLSTGNKYRIRIVADAPHAISDDNGFDITISPLTAKPVITANTAVCEGDTLHLAADCPTPGVSYSWTGPNNFSEPSSRTLTFYPADSTGTGTYIVQVKLGQCPPKYDTVDVTVKPLPQPLTATYNNPIWEGQNLHLTAINNNAVSYVWSGPQDYTSGEQSPMRPNVTKGMAGMYTVVATKDGCSSTAWVTVVIDDYPDSCSFSYYPNPNKSIFTIKGCTISDEDIQYNIINSIGQIITRGTITPQNKYFNKTITLGQVANGVYFLRATIDRRINLPIIIIR